MTILKIANLFFRLLLGPLNECLNSVLQLVQFAGVLINIMNLRINDVLQKVIVFI